MPSLDLLTSAGASLIVLLAVLYATSHHGRALIRGGLAQVGVFSPNTAHAGDFYGYQEEAGAAGRGIWALPASERCRLGDRGNGFGEGSPGCQR